MFDLKESDLPELERLAKIGYPWIARDASGLLYGYKRKPVKKTAINEWYDMTFYLIGNEREEARFVQWSDPEPLNIAAAIAQIKAQNSATDIPVGGTPLTWNERINQMTVSEKADWMKDNDFCIVMKLQENGCFEFNSCTECLETWLNSPYTEGATK